METEDESRYRLRPEEARYLVDCHRVTGVEGAEEERLPTLGHTSRRIRVERMIVRPIDTPGEQHGSEHDDGCQRRSRIRWLVVPGFPARARNGARRLSPRRHVIGQIPVSKEEVEEIAQDHGDDGL